jgi:hypothetical protein
MPDRALFVDVTGSLVAAELVWNAYGVEIEDYRHTYDISLPDGSVDELTLSGPPVR